MSPGLENKKRKHEDPSPAQATQSDTGSILSNLPALPPPPISSPPSLSQTATQTTSASQRHSATAQSTSLPHSGVTMTSSKRPKRARSKSEKKEDNERQSRFHCDYCGRDLSSSVRARCAVCPDYDSCLDCFSVGAALLPHKAEHDYRLVEVVHASIFQAGWSAEEEEKLLEGLESYGVGNWEQVATSIGSKNAVETEQHYLNIYLQSPTAPLPDPHRLVLAENNSISDSQDEVDQKSLRVMHMHQQEDAAGYMPKRQDFVYEWDNEAEDIIGDMEIAEEDNKTERDLKLDVLEIYCEKLNERERRKKFVRERGMTDVKAHQSAEKKRSKEERELREKMKVFMRFMPQDDMDSFIKGLVEERDLRNRIEMLKEGRSHGAKTIEECQRIAVKHSKKEMRASGSSGGGIRTSSGAGNNHMNSGETSVLSGLSQRRLRRSNGDGGLSEASNYSVLNGGHGGSNSGGVDSKDNRKGILNDVDMDVMTGSELLSSKEIALCKSLNITPHQYMIVKEVMIRESARYGSLKKREARAIIKLDHNQVNRIHEYLSGCGWIRTGTVTPANVASGVVNSFSGVGGAGTGSGTTSGAISAIATGTGTAHNPVSVGARISTSDEHLVTNNSLAAASANANGTARLLNNGLTTNVNKSQPERA